MKKNKITNCPACLSRLTTTRVGVYIVCAKCHMMYLSKLPDVIALKKDIEQTGQWIIDDAGNNDVLQTHKDRLKALRKFIKRKGRLLDVGCGKGQFIYHAKTKGYTVAAMDLSQNIVKFIKKSLRIPTYGDLSVIRKKFDTLTAFDVIEHTIEPEKFVDDIKQKLLPHGIFMLTTPNAIGISGRVLGKRWWAFGPDGHFNLFTTKALQILLRRKGFKVVHCTTDTLTQWFPANNTLGEKGANKIIYLLLQPFLGVVYSHMLGDNIEIIAQKL